MLHHMPEALIKEYHGQLSQISQCYVFFRYALAGILQHWLEYFCKLTKAFRYSLPRILQEWLEHFCKLTHRFQVYTTQDSTALIRAFLRVNSRFQVYTTQDTTALVRVFLQVKGVFRHTERLINFRSIFFLGIFHQQKTEILKITTYQQLLG